MIKKYIKDILIIENFLSVEEVKLLQEFCNTAEWNESNDAHEVWSTNIKKNLPKEISAILESAEEKILDLLPKNKHVNFQFQIHRLRSDNQILLSEHFDSNMNDKITDGIIIYINNNFDGGELVYTKLGISIKPVPGMFIMHPGSEEYSHKVNPVSSTRYMITQIAGYKKYMN